MSTHVALMIVDREELSVGLDRDNLEDFPIDLWVDGERVASMSRKQAEKLQYHLGFALDEAGLPLPGVWSQDR